MFVSQKKQYALRALLELSRRHGLGPVKASAIARAQGIPGRFLEAILNEMKRGGFVRSKRGYQGGYALSRPPAEIVVGDVIRFLESSGGPDYDPGPGKPWPGGQAGGQEQDGDDALSSMWEKVVEAMYCVYDGTSMQDLLELERSLEQDTEKAMHDGPENGRGIQ